MEIIFKIIAIGLITCLATMIVRPIRSDFAVIIGLYRKSAEKATAETG